MAKVTQDQLQVWASTLVNEEDCLMEVRDRFQMRMLEKFRTAAPAVREQINAIMDNEVAFFDELKAITAEIGTVNTTKEDEI